jgi:hypothetical protein
VTPADFPRLKKQRRNWRAIIFLFSDVAVASALHSNLVRGAPIQLMVNTEADVGTWG